MSKNQTYLMKYIFIILALFPTLLVNAQSIEQIKANTQTYIWGEGTGATLKTADNEALSFLISQVSTQVESSFELLKRELTKNNESEITEKVNSVVKTYSDATLKNTERIVVSNEPDAKVFRYIKRAEINKIFEQRKNKIIELAEYGEKALREYKIADALRYYYWGLTLLKSHPDGNAIKYYDQNGQEQLLAMWFPASINNIFSNISCNVTDIDKNDNYKSILLSINYKSNTVTNFDYSYWDGSDWSNLYSAKDGKGFIELYGVAKDMRNLKLKAEYIFEGEARINREIETVLSKIDPIPFRKSYYTIPVRLTKVDKTAEDKSVEELTKVQNPECYKKNIAEVLSAIPTKNYESIKKNFTPEGFAVFKKLIHYGNAKIVAKPKLSFIKFGEKVICRSVPMSFNFKSNNKQFIEDIVFYFNTDCKINTLSFALSKTALDDILNKNVWSERDRLVLVSFLEHYKTAYALKRLNYIESIFADDALIITGYYLKLKNNGDHQFKNNRILRYNRQTKQQYIKNLRYSFGSKEYINIKFEKSEIRKAGKGGDIYGVQIRQNYFSSNYGDVGYLFLMADLNNPDIPVIHVRTWQPEKDSTGNIYGLGDFN